MVSSKASPVLPDDTEEHKELDLPEFDAVKPPHKENFVDPTTMKKMIGSAEVISSNILDFEEEEECKIGTDTLNKNFESSATLIHKKYFGDELEYSQLKKIQSHNDNPSSAYFAGIS